MRSLRRPTNNNSDLYGDFRQIVEKCAGQRTIHVVFPVPSPIRLMRPLAQEATRIDIESHFEPNLLLRVMDNGKGMNPAVASLGRDGHFGLCGMRERASRIGAKFSLDTSPGRGTIVTLRVPKATAFETRGFEDSTEMDTLRLMLRRFKEFLGLG